MTFVEKLLEQPEDVLATLTVEDVLWVNDKTRDTEIEEEQALAILLAHNVLILNNNWWRKDFSEADQESMSCAVNCSDVFAWGCADAESLPYCGIDSLFRCWLRDRSWGPAIWSICNRRRPPQQPVAAIIRKGGIWDIDDIVSHFDVKRALLSPNPIRRARAANTSGAV